MDRTAIRSAAPMLLPRRARESSKRDYGRLLIVGGSTGYSGAPTLASRAAVRSGAGLVNLFVPESIYTVAAVKNDEAMVAPVPADEAGRMTMRGIAAIEDLLPHAGALCMGPGLGRSEELIRLVHDLLLEADCPVVLDADALWCFSRFEPKLLRRVKGPVVLTPHQGEFERCLGGRSDAPRLDAARAFAGKYGVILVLKGAGTVTAFPDGRAYVNTTGNPGLARGGSGDVLTGIMGALLCQFPADKAVPLAVFLHGLAGDLAAEEKGEYGMNLLGVIDFLPQAMKLIEEE